MTFNTQSSLAWQYHDILTSHAVEFSESVDSDSTRSSVDEDWRINKLEATHAGPWHILKSSPPSVDNQPSALSLAFIHPSKIKSVS